MLFKFKKIVGCIEPGVENRDTNRIVSWCIVTALAARVLTKTKELEHITPILKSLHWLPVGQRTDFKIMLLTYKSLHGLGPKYLTDMLPLHKPSRPLRSSETNLLTQNMGKQDLVTMQQISGINSQRI